MESTISEGMLLNIRLTKKMEELYEESQKKIQDLHQELFLSKEKNKETLERLKTKFSVLETSVMQKHKESCSEMEKENSKLHTQITKLKVGTNETAVCPTDIDCRS